MTVLPRPDRVAAAEGPLGAPPQAAAGRLILGIASTGRPAVLAETVAGLARQTRLPDRVLLSLSGPEDLDAAALPPLPFPVEILSGPRGLTRQRNRLLDELAADDLLAMIDDDFLLAPDWLAGLERLFRAEPGVAMVTGTVLADGIGGPGYDHAEGARLLADGLARPAGDGLREVFNGYGCNFAIRAAPVLAHDLRFDEDLPLYGWLEDVDFSRQLAAHGRIVQAAALRGVHLGTKTGRTPGLRMGYSQIANPIYLIRKGTDSWSEALDILLRNLASNLLRTLRPKPWTDHRGRLRGNLIGLAHLLTGRLHPTRVLDLPG